jgi:RHS repeat-associated protein
MRNTTQYHPLNCYPFGSSMVSFSNTKFSFAYGFNGMEKDDEVKGDGNSLDFGARIYDSRLGRWLSLDPLKHIQPGLSPYKSFLNNPLYFGDNAGETEKIQTITINSKGETIIDIVYKDKVMTDGNIHQVWDSRSSFHYENNYYNFTTTVVKYVDKEGKEHIVSSKSKILDNTIIQSEYVWDTWNIKNGTAGDPYGETAKDSRKTSVKGGIAFYSKNGQSQETKTTTGVANMVDIGPILDAISAFSPGGGLQGKLDDVYKKIKLGNDAEALKVAINIMGKIMETIGEVFDKGYTIAEAVKNVEVKSSKPSSDSTTCKNEHCGKKISKETGLGEGDNPDYKGHRVN